MDEILLFESTGSIEYYPDPDNVEEDTSLPEESKEEDQEHKIADPVVYIGKGKEPSLIIFT